MVDLFISRKVVGGQDRGVAWSCFLYISVTLSTYTATHLWEKKTAWNLGLFHFPCVKLVNNIKARFKSLFSFPIALIISLQFAHIFIISFYLLLFYVVSTYKKWVWWNYLPIKYHLIPFRSWDSGFRANFIDFLEISKVNVNLASIQLSLTLDRLMDFHDLCTSLKKLESSRC